nr:hypothetical protein [Mycobacterium florentinum]
MIAHSLSITLLHVASRKNRWRMWPSLLLTRNQLSHCVFHQYRPAWSRTAGCRRR